MENDAVAMEWRYELLDVIVDAMHRNHLAIALPHHGEAPIELALLWLCTPMIAWGINPRCIPRLRDSRLLPLARMVEATVEDAQDRCNVSRRFLFDRCLLTALIDH